MNPDSQVKKRRKKRKEHFDRDDKGQSRAESDKSNDQELKGVKSKGKKRRKRKTKLDKENQEVEKKLSEYEERSHAGRSPGGRETLSDFGTDTHAEEEEPYDSDAIVERIRDPELALALRDLQDDVDSIEEGDVLASLREPLSSSRTPHTVSKHVDKIYTEKIHGNGFAKTTARSKKAKGPRMIRMPSSVDPNRTGQISVGLMTPTQFAIFTQKGFRALGVFCHGLIAGISFMHVLTVLVISSESDSVLDYLSYYSPLSQPLNCLFYLLGIFCMISTLDRYDFAALDWRQMQMLLTCRSAGLAILVYMITLVLTLATTTLDDRWSLHQINATILQSWPQEDLEREFQLWRGLTICRSIGFILGWILISLRPGTDLLQKNLKKMIITSRTFPVLTGVVNHGFMENLP